MRLCSRRAGGPFALSVGRHAQCKICRAAEFCFVTQCKFFSPALFFSSARFCIYLSSSRALKLRTDRPPVYAADTLWAPSGRLSGVDKDIIWPICAWRGRGLGLKAVYCLHCIGQCVCCSLAHGHFAASTFLATLTHSPALPTHAQSPISCPSVRHARSYGRTNC